MAAHSHGGHPHGGLDNPDTSHEHGDINVRAIIGFIVALTVITLVIQVAMWGLLRGLQHYERTNEPYVSPLAAAPAKVADFPGPSLQTTPWTDLKAFRAEQEDYLHGYGWVDEKLGVARIPIARAKEMLLQKGIAVRPELEDASEGTHVAASGESNGGRTIPAGQADKSAPASATGAAGASGAAAADAAAAGPAGAAGQAKKPGGLR